VFAAAERIEAVLADCTAGLAGLKAANYRAFDLDAFRGTAYDRHVESSRLEFRDRVLAVADDEFHVDGPSPGHRRSAGSSSGQRLSLHTQLRLRLATTG
jgi:hypothetical protein